MDSLRDYGDQEDGGSSVVPAAPGPAVSLRRVNVAPAVHSTELSVRQYESPAVAELTRNVEYDALWAPTLGPSHPVLSRPTIARGGKNHLTGFVQEEFVDKFSFNEQLNAFNSYGHALDPSSGAEIYDSSRKISSEPRPKEKRKRSAFGAADDLNSFQGPWAPYEDEERVRKEFADAADRAAEEIEKMPEAPKRPKATIKQQEDEVVQAKSVFHGKVLRDYLGRTYIDPPSHLKPSMHECFLPKRQIHNWPAHPKGVSSIRWFPTYGHLVLSGGMDHKVKIWDVYNKQKLLRTFMGHSKAVRDICFNYDGRRFVSASYDRRINLWDTETGECLGSYSNGAIPYCVKFHPDPNRGHIFLAGCSDKKIIQWDTNSGKISQQYDQHLGPVNTITFVDGNRRFISSSDDKSIRVWEWGIPVVIKYISEPHMHSMPAIAVHPEGGYFAAQSQDNQIVVYSAQNKFKINKKKVFSGHQTAGYACQIDFSPDGHFIMSGDADGKLWFWDWNNCRVVKTLQAHEGVCIGSIWHPIETSRIITCSWDGSMKYWD